MDHHVTGEGGGQARHGVANSEGGTHCALGIIAVRDRRSEHRHGTVADMLVDVAAVVGHDAINHGEETIEEIMDLFGTNLAAQPCVADKVGKKNSDLSPFAIRSSWPSYPRRRYINLGRGGSQSGDSLK